MICVNVCPPDESDNQWRVMLWERGAPHSGLISCRQFACRASARSYFDSMEAGLKDINHDSASSLPDLYGTGHAKETIRGEG